MNEMTFVEAVTFPDRLLRIVFRNETLLWTMKLMFIPLYCTEIYEYTHTFDERVLAKWIGTTKSAWKERLKLI